MSDYPQSFSGNAKGPAPRYRKDPAHHARRR
jgi:hypothetical protein